MAPATEDELCAAVRHSTHFGAVHALLVSRGIRVWTGISGGPQDDPDAARALLVPYPDPRSEEYATWGTRTQVTEVAWARSPVSDFAVHRRDLMAQAMEALLAEPSPNSAVRVFSGDHASVEARSGTRAIRNALVAAWWDHRRAEGHSLDSARTMMRLIVTPDAWGIYDALLDVLDAHEGAGCEDADAEALGAPP